MDTHKRVYNEVLLRAEGEKAGFTLVEVMISILVFAVLMVGVFGALKQGSDLAELSRDETRVTQILQSEIEDLRTKNWAAISAMASSETYAPTGRFALAFGNRYSCTRTISSRATDQKEVIVTVSWTDNSGSAHSREFKTWVTKGGLSDYYYRSF